MALKNFFSKKTFFFIVAIVILVFAFFAIKIVTFKMPTKEIKISDIKSINIINFSKERRIKYEQNLKKKFGNYFLGQKIDSNLKLKNTCNGRTELTVENMINGERIVYNDVKNKKGLSTFKDGVWKICSKYNKNECLYYSLNVNKNPHFDNEIFNVFGCWFSHIRAIEKVSKQPDNTYGLIFEDDFDVSNNFNKNIKKALANVPKDFDVLRLTLSASNIYKKHKKLSFFSSLKERLKSYKKNGYGKWIDLSVQKTKNPRLSHGAHAYLISSQGAKKILSYVRNNITLCVADTDLFFNIPKSRKDIKIYAYTDDVPFILADYSNKSQIVIN